MPEAQDPLTRILDLLWCCRREAGEPRMGTTEWEIANGFRRDLPGTNTFKLITRLRQLGLVTRGSDGFVWVREDVFNAHDSASAALAAALKAPRPHR